MISPGLSKLGIALVSPLGTALALGTVGALLILWRGRPRSQRLGALLVLFSLSWLWTWSLPPASEWLQQQVEKPYPARRAEDLPPVQAIVLLGGALVPPARGNPYPDMTSAADRAWHAARLFHAGKASVVVASGGSDGGVTPVSEAEALRTLLVDLGVPPAAIMLEPHSRNTRENAEFTASLLRERRMKSVLLVTSALHMRRALRAFERAGLEAVPAATDHSTPRSAGLQHWVPDTASLDASARALKELAGTVVYEISTPAR